MKNLDIGRKAIVAAIAGKKLSSVPSHDNGRTFRNTDLRGIDLSNMTLCNFDFSHADLRGACLEDSRLIDCTFIGANLTGANLRGVDARDSDWRGAVLWDADLSTARNFNSTGVIIGTARMAPTESHDRRNDLSLSEWRRARHGVQRSYPLTRPLC